jgi:hypothetical protein
LWCVLHKNKPTGAKFNVAGTSDETRFNIVSVLQLRPCSVMAVMAPLGNTTSSLSVGSPVVRWFEAFPSRKFGARFDLRGVSRGPCHRINVA